VHLSREEGDWIWTMSFAYCVWHIDCHGARDTHAPTLWARGSWFCVFRMSGGVLATLSLAAWSCIVLHCGVGEWERRGTLDRRTEREKERQECLLYDNDRDMESGEQKWSSSRRSTTCLSIPPARLPNQAGDWIVRALRFADPCC
jgi:hypothetical protein